MPPPTTANPQSAIAAAAAASITLANYTPAGGSTAKKLVVLWAMKRAGSSVAPGTFSAAWGAVPMSVIGAVNVTGSPYHRLILTELNIGSSTATADIVGQVASSNPTWIAIAATLLDVDQVAAEAFASTATSNGPTNITTLTAGALLIGGAQSADNALAGLNVAETLVLTRTLNTGNPASESVAGMSMRVAGAAGAQTMSGWTSGTRPSHLVASFRAAASPAVLTATGASLALSAAGGAVAIGTAVQLAAQGATLALATPGGSIVIGVATQLAADAASVALAAPGGAIAPGQAAVLTANGAAVQLTAAGGALSIGTAVELAGAGAMIALAAAGAAIVVANSLMRVALPFGRGFASADRGGFLARIRGRFTASSRGRL